MGGNHRQSDTTLAFLLRHSRKESPTPEIRLWSEVVVQLFQDALTDCAEGRPAREMIERNTPEFIGLCEHSVFAPSFIKRIYYAEKEKRWRRQEVLMAHASNRKRTETKVDSSGRR